MADEFEESGGLNEIPASEILAKIEKGKPVDYESIIIKGDLDISGLNLPKKHINRTDLEINSLGFEENIAVTTSVIKIIDSEIHGISDFGEVLFEKEVDFSGFQFIGHADFRGSVFDGPTDFSRAQFSEEALFSGSRFTGGAEFNGCQFNKWAQFLGFQVRGYADFQECQFNEKADFLRSQFSEYAIDFGGSKFNGQTYFNKSEFGEDVYFNQCVFNGDLYLSGSQFKGDILTFKYSKFSSPKSQEEACRRAKNVLEKNGDRVEAGYHFYKEMEGKRKRRPWYIRYPEFVFIQLIFGYGVHPFRLWACWFIFVSIFAATYWIGNGVIGATQILDYIWFSITVAVTPGFAGYKPAPGLFQLIAGLEAMFGTFMWAAFIATFARKYMK